MRLIAAVIVMGITAEVHALPLAMQQPIDSAQAMPVARAEFERLGGEVRAALVASPEKFSHERYGKFVELQAARGDLDGARESARQGDVMPRYGLRRHARGDLGCDTVSTVTGAPGNYQRASRCVFGCQPAGHLTSIEADTQAAVPRGRLRGSASSSA